jgi:hypothetical protein
VRLAGACVEECQQVIDLAGDTALAGLLKIARADLGPKGEVIGDLDGNALIVGACVDGPLDARAK